MERPKKIIRIIKSRKVSWIRYVACIGEKINANRASVGTPEGIRLLGRPRRRREDNVKIDLREIGWCGIDWIRLVLNRYQRRVLVNLPIL
jgi:hypothetical protein